MRSAATGAGQPSRPAPAALEEAVVHHQAGRLALARKFYRNILASHPGDPDTLHLLGVVEHQQGRSEQAVELIQQALAANPDHPGYLSNLGNALEALDQLDAAIACYRKAAAVQPKFVDAWFNLGGALRQRGDDRAAMDAFRRVVAIDPTHFEARMSLGDLLTRAGCPCQAVEHFRQAVAVDPAAAQAHYNLGIALRDQGSLHEAIACFEAALEREPDHLDAISCLVFTKHYLPEHSPAAAMADHQAFAQRFEPLVARWPRHERPPEPERRLKLGFVSGDFRRHPVGYFIENVLANLDRSAWDVTLYSTNPFSDDLTQRLRDLGFEWVSLAGLTDDSASERIRADGIDILIDLSGHTKDNRLLVFARKPAPVQVTWLGYFATTGLAAMDYILGDRYSVADGDVGQYVERVWRLPESRLCLTPPDAELPVGRLPALDRGAVTFGCFNTLMKMNDAVVRLWARVLDRIPRSRLLLKAKSFVDPGMRRLIHGRFAAHGIKAGRILLEEASPRAEYLAAYQRIDIMLDPFPYPGGTTSLEGLWMGVPLITLRGDRMLARQGECILRNLGLDDWIADDPASYVAQAVARAADLPALADLRGRLRAQLLASPLCDAPRFARNLEAAFRGMWREHCARSSGNPPADTF